MWKINFHSLTFGKLELESILHIKRTLIEFQLCKIAALSANISFPIWRSQKITYLSHLNFQPCLTYFSLGDEIGFFNWKWIVLFIFRIYSMWLYSSLQFTSQLFVICSLPLTIVNINSRYTATATESAAFHLGLVWN